MLGLLWSRQARRSLKLVAGQMVAQRMEQISNMSDADLMGLKEAESAEQRIEGSRVALSTYHTVPKEGVHHVVVDLDALLPLGISLRMASDGIALADGKRQKLSGKDLW